MPPSPEEQLAFLTKIQRILAEGQFTATYKYALLLALADLAVEIGDDSGAALAIPTRSIAEKFVLYYWRHAIPYILPARPGIILRQNADRQAAFVRHVHEARQRYGDSLPVLRQNSRAWNALVSRVEGVFWRQPLWRLQRIGAQSLDFLYSNRDIDTRVEMIELLPGVAFCLRRFHGLITALLHSAWVEFVRKCNQEALATTAELADFMFGSERGCLTLLRPALLDLQGGHRFYCGGQLRGVGHVDHFIPWSRYPVDLGLNLVLAHDSCNNAKGSMLAAEEHLARWTERNSAHSNVIQTGCSGSSIGADLEAAVQVARWAYGQAFAAGGMNWLRAKELTPIGRAWETILCSGVENATAWNACTPLTA